MADASIEEDTRQLIPGIQIQLNYPSQEQQDTLTMKKYICYYCECEYNLNKHVVDHLVESHASVELKYRELELNVETGRPSNMKNRRTLDLKLVGFTISCITKFVTGSVFVFFLYQDAIKHTFGYSQKQVEILGSMINIGLGLGFIPGIFFDHCGPRLTSFVSLFVSSGAYLLLWSTNLSIQFYTDKVWLMAVFFLLAGFGPGFSLMVCLNTNLINFGERHTGKVVGILNAFFAGSPSVFASVYYKYFVHGDATLASNQNYKGFVLMIAIMFGVVNLLCIICVGLYPEIKDADKRIDIHQSDDDNKQQDENVSTSEIDGVSSEVEQDISVPVIKLLRDIDFILLLLAFTFSSTVSLVFGVNITIISKSVGLDSYNNTLTLILPICNAILSVIIGVFSDYFKVRIPRLKIIIVGSVCFVICFLLTVVLPTNIDALMAAAGFCGTGVAIIFSMTPAVIKETTNTKNFGRNWGIALFIQAIVSMPSQIIFGAMYDRQIEGTGSTDCQGAHCIVGGMGVFLGVSVISTLLWCALFYKTRHNRIWSREGYRQINN